MTGAYAPATPPTLSPSTSPSIPLGHMRGSLFLFPPRCPLSLKNTKSIASTFTRKTLSNINGTTATPSNRSPFINGSHAAKSLPASTQGTFPLAFLLRTPFPFGASPRCFSVPSTTQPPMAAATRLHMHLPRYPGCDSSPTLVPAACSATAVLHAAANVFRTVDSIQETPRSPPRIPGAVIITPPRNVAG
ncbi:hypothetical protein B0H14DRAFT_3437410 [Mycena olivaceomarginata]|nr:hypothetical protein B0H14DRAFT_3437410 [Mycena olivaceomarginata]